MGPSTLSSLELLDEPESSGPDGLVYYEPQPVVAVSNHKTLEVQTVKLAEDIDPRKLATELRLTRPNECEPPSDAAWPTQTALTTGQRPTRLSRRWLTSVVLLSLLVALFLVRAATRSTASVDAGNVSATGSESQITGQRASVPTRSATPARPLVQTPVADESAPAASASVTPKAAPTHPVRALQSSHSASVDAREAAASQPRTASSSNKPKHAIY